MYQLLYNATARRFTKGPLVLEDNGNDQWIGNACNRRCDTTKQSMALCWTVAHAQSSTSKATACACFCVQGIMQLGQIV